MDRKKASDFPQELINLLDHYVHGRIDRRGPGKQRYPADRTACRHPWRCAPATDCSGGIRRWTRSDWAGGEPYGEIERSNRCR